MATTTEEDVYLTRHGSRIDKEDYDWMRKAGHQRRDDPHLSPAGEEQAKELAAKMLAVHKERPIAHIVCSPFVRCVQTAVPVAEALGLQIKIEPGVCEVLLAFPPGFLDTEELSRTFANIDQAYTPVVMRSSLSREHGDSQAASRAARAASEVRRQLQGRILFVGHGASCLGIAEAFGSGDYVGYASLSHFTKSSGGGWQTIGKLGDVSHLSTKHQRVSLASAF